jgi:fructose/tagatose bisphosphate aldolase
MRLQTLHLDHGQDIKTIQSCIENGFTSVMIDGSHLEFQQNIAITKEVVGLAMKKAVSMEAELGRLKSIEDKLGISKINIYTDLRLSCVGAVREVLVTKPDEFDPRKVLGLGREAIKQTIQSKMRLFGSSGKAA